MSRVQLMTPDKRNLVAESCPGKDSEKQRGSHGERTGLGPRVSGTGTRRGALRPPVQDLNCGDNTPWRLSRTSESQSLLEVSNEGTGADSPQRTYTDRMTSDFIFDRQEERQRMDQFLAKRYPFLICGPSGVGKTLLLRNVLSDFRSVLYCHDSATINMVFRSLALALVRFDSPRAKQAFRDEGAIAKKSAVALKGIVIDALREGEYAIVLDHLKRPSYSFAAAVREIMGRGSTPVSAVARSSHMEDTGFLQPLYGDRSQKCELRNFDDATAQQFACEMIKRRGLSGANMAEFLNKVLEFSAGNPGAIITMIDMARYPKYRAEEHIKTSLLYIDFRMQGGIAR